MTVESIAEDREEIQKFDFSITIDEEFKNEIPPLGAEEYAQLEKNILGHGCRDPLVVWDGVLLDGHHRYEICEKHNIPYSVDPVYLPDRDSALDWIHANQLGRRNLTPDQFRYYLGLRYNRMKKAAHRPEKRGQSDHVNPERTAESLAKEYGASEKTVRRAGKFASEIEQEPRVRAWR